MLYVAIGLSISLTNLAAPISCLTQLFYWKQQPRNEIVNETEGEKQVPETVAEMKELIKILKAK